MKRVNIAEAKAGLSSLLRLVRGGEAVVICDRNVPIAELRRIEPRSTAMRLLGPGRAGFELSAAFFEPLPTGDARARSGRG